MGRWQALTVRVVEQASTTIDETVATFRRWLHMDDADSLLATLGTIAANRLEGDPVWLLLVGPPGGGKSEILNALSGLSYTRTAGTLTEASLLSGTPKKDHATASKGGLLMEIGEFGIIVAKDFGSILSMNRDSQAQTLAALREVYDGSWTRLVGTDGGRSLHWAGKVGFVGGVTPTIDRHHAVMGAMGERFMLFRLPNVDADTQARRALSHAGKEKRMRKELSDSVAAVLDDQAMLAREPDEDEIDQLVALGTLVVRARSAVERDNYTREIELVPGSEAPTRFTIMLKRLLTGMYAIGMDRPAAWRVLAKVGLDSIPALRLSIMAALADYDGTLSTNDLATAVRHPATTTRRSCEDLVAHGLLELTRQGEGKAHLWELTTFARERLETIFGGLPKATSDKAGTLKIAVTEPIQETFPEMSASDDTAPERPIGEPSKSFGNLIEDNSGTLATSTNRNNGDGHELAPLDETLAAYPDANPDERWWDR
jgi:energy-coupling factor transporter ATP-binding protein EcfA2